MFERFTERARQVVVLAQDEARTLRHNYIGTEHLLLGLLREEEGVAARVLESLDVTLEEVRSQVARIVGPGDENVAGQIPFTPNAKKTLERALRAALDLGHNHIGTEHILLAVAETRDSIAAQILAAFDVDADTIRNDVIRTLSGPGRPQGGVAAELRSRPPRSQGGPHEGLGYAPARMEAVPLLLGWLLFGVALGLGVLIGWAIWGL